MAEERKKAGEREGRVGRGAGKASFVENENAWKVE